VFNKEVHIFSTAKIIKIFIIVPFLSILGHSVFAESCFTTGNYIWSCGSPSSNDSL